FESTKYSSSESDHRVCRKMVRPAPSQLVASTHTNGLCKCTYSISQGTDTQCDLYLHGRSNYPMLKEGAIVRGSFAEKLGNPIFR
ncbi:hypothetical protein HAX54_035249, partial [Datura stramonium]|nr:hypothetical protein [Datura stramonium]